MLLKHLMDLTLVDLLNAHLQVVESLLTLDTVSLIGVALKHELPDLSILFHKRAQHFDVSIFFFIDIHQLIIFRSNHFELFGRLFFDNECPKFLFLASNVACYSHEDSSLGELVVQMLLFDGLFVLFTYLKG